MIDIIYDLCSNVQWQASACDILQAAVKLDLLNKEDAEDIAAELGIGLPLTNWSDIIGKTIKSVDETFGPDVVKMTFSDGTSAAIETLT